MHPVLFVVGEVTIYAYGVLQVLGVLVAVAAAIGLSRRLEVSGTRVVAVLASAGAVGAIAGKLAFALLNRDHFAEALLASAGTVYLGAFASGLLAVVAGAVVARGSVGATLDVAAVALATQAAIGRVGCFFAGCCWGRPTSGPWGVRFPFLLDPQLRGVPVHPTQLYTAVCWAAVAGLLVAVAPWRRGGGELFLLGVFAFAAARLGLAFTADVTPATLVLYPTLAALAALALVVLRMTRPARAGPSAASGAGQ